MDERKKWMKKVETEDGKVRVVDLVKTWFTGLNLRWVTQVAHGVWGGA